ncbi:MAG TPA: DUF58 domain-containing protein, partial [Armatimonadetes bacterium]|nr:DUF58 domain-containing protein [Armatimonadota bacterium]
MKVLGWILLCLCILGVAYVFHIGFFAYALYALLAAILVSQALGHYSLVGVTQERFCSARRARIGDTFNVSVEVRNEKLLPVVWMLAEDLVPEHLEVEGTAAKVVFLRSGRSFSLAYQVKCTLRGYYQLGPLMLESGDLFGLVRRFKTGEEANYVIVHPKVVPIWRYGIATRRPVGEVRVQQKIYEDPSRMVGVREYQQGDRLTRIHWRATARVGRLLSKVYEPTTMVGALLALDFHAPTYGEVQRYERSELGVVAAASLAKYICDQRQAVGFISNGRDAADRVRWEREEREVASRAEARQLATLRERSERLRPVEVETRRGGEQLQLILDALARLELSDGLPFSEMLRNEYPRLPRDAAFVALVPQVTPHLLAVFEEMKRSGFVITVFILQDPLEFHRAQAPLEAA